MTPVYMIILIFGASYCRFLGHAGMKGTGRWTVQEAAERSTAAPTMAAALDARYMSGRKAERVEASKTLKGPDTIPKVPKAQLIEDMKAALYCSKICSYAQVHIGVVCEMWYAVHLVCVVPAAS